MSKNGRASNAAIARGLEFFEQLLLIRRTEERLSTLFADGEVPGFIHLSIGQEAVSVGVMAALGQGDSVASTHRGHGHALAKGMALDAFFAELLARDTGLCRGRGGSMHVADTSIGMLGANGIVGAGVPIATGAALAHQLAGKGRVAVAFFGDGALAEGVLHESFNLAQLWRLPILFVCEANGWSEFSPVGAQIAFDLAAWAKAYGMPYHRVDGNDVLAIADLASGVVTTIREGAGPAVLECRTHRVRGHFEGDAQKYRTDTAAPNDPIALLSDQLALLGVSADTLAMARDAADARIEAAVAAARLGPAADFEAARHGVYGAAA